MHPGQAEDDDAGVGETSFLFGVGPPDLTPGGVTERDSPSDEGTRHLSQGPDAPGPGPRIEAEGGGFDPSDSGDESGKVDGFAFPQPTPGEVFLGRYRIERRLGAGGMGTVWLVTHLTLDVPRALKLITAGVATNPSARTRFRREARVMARLSHLHAVAVHDARLAADGAFIEMEYVRGKSLTQLLNPGEPMPRDWIIRVVEQLCDVLQAAHENGVVHRDLKPSNLMLLDGRPPGQEFLKVLDFGIAKVLRGVENEPEDLSTRTGAALYTPQYASPEQAMDLDVDTRSDLYSLGVMLYEFLTGYRPFTGPGVTYGHIHTPPPSFHVRNPAVAVPPEIESLVFRCLAKLPEDRPQSARELLNEFREVVARAGWDLAPASSTALARATGWTEGTTRTVADPDTPRQAHPPDTGVRTRLLPGPTPETNPPGAPLDRREAVAVPPKPDAPPPRRRRWPIAWLAACLLGAAAYFGWGMWRRGPETDRLPAGYAAQGPADATDGAPKALVRGDGTRFVLIRGGPFPMGNDSDPSGRGPADDRPAHPVVVSDYYLQEAEVTNGELEAYFRGRHIRQDDRPRRWRVRCNQIEERGIDPNPLPAVGIPHEVAERYARSVGGRLPTEAEWEYAARSRGERRRYVWGDTPRPGPKVANVDSTGEHECEVVAARTYPRDRTEQGVFDLAGNVREWCHDVFAAYPAPGRPVVDPEGPPRPAAPESAPFVIRGGSFLSWSDECSTTGPRRPPQPSATATDLAEDGSARDLGFRVAIPRRGR